MSLDVFQKEKMTDEKQYTIGNLTDCETNPSGYKLCSPYTCITRETPCPCGPFEYTCANFRCIPDSRLCDLNDDCWDNGDEYMCNRQDMTSEMLSIPVLAGIIVGCVVFITILVVATILYLKWKKRKRKTGGKTDDSTDNKKHHLHENEALVTSTSMEESNEKKELNQKPVLHNHKPVQNNLIDKHHIPLEFEEGLLCTSTPKQPLRQLLMKIKSIDDV